MRNFAFRTVSERIFGSMNLQYNIHKNVQRRCRRKSFLVHFKNMHFDPKVRFALSTRPMTIKQQVISAYTNRLAALMFWFSPLCPG